MKPVMKFEKEKIMMGSLGEEAAFPAILSGVNIQNKTVFELEEDDEIYEGFGKLVTVYPYRHYTSYNRKLEEKEVETVILENDALRAVFLPTLGGRLWRLVDKKTGENLLYTNDCIRPSNLATRNAWFSGGVEWNVGIVGHTPLTMEPLFAAKLKDEKGNPVLRMYEYERIRKVVYQMDFWLEEKGVFLNCRMRVVNGASEVIPMYWWSNTAVPEYKNGRIFVPAMEAFTSDRNRVYKVKIPMVNGVDISKYQGIPNQVDYFFHIPETEKKYIAHLNGSGYGLLHLSTNRLCSRKLFVWGHNDASARWQEFLTSKAGDYIEVQGGIGKTQYGCIPMAPHTAWEWIEQYGAVRMDEKVVKENYKTAEKCVAQKVEEILIESDLERMLQETRKMSKEKGEVFLRGSGYANLENQCRRVRGEKPLETHLDFASEDERQQEWSTFLETGKLPCPNPQNRPADFTKDDFWYELLKETVKETGRENWYAHYQLGLQYLDRRKREQAKQEFVISCELEDNVWAAHGKAVCLTMEGRQQEAVREVKKILDADTKDLSMVKECFALFLEENAYENLVNEYLKLPEEYRQESRIYFAYIQAVAGMGQYREAYEILVKDGGVEIADMREGDDSMEKLWKELMEKLGENKTIPHKLNFCAI